METKINIEGSNVKDFLHYLEEDEQKLADSKVYYEPQYDNTGTSYSVELATIAISGITSGIVQVLAAYFARGLNNEVEISREINGKKVTVKLKNRSHDEINEILKEL